MIKKRPTKNYIGKKFLLEWHGEDRIATVTHLHEKHTYGVTMYREDNPDMDYKDENDSVICAGIATTVACHVLRDIDEDEDEFVPDLTL